MIDDNKVHLLKSINNWLLLIWLTMITFFFFGSVWSSGIQKEIRGLHETINIRYEQAEGAIVAEKEKIYKIITEMQDFEEKTLVIRRKRGQYYISIIKKGEHEDKK